MYDYPLDTAMLNTQNVKINSVVSFDLYAEAILGAKIRNAKVLSILDAQDAARYIANPVTMHAAVFPSLPPDTPNRYDGYPYLKLKLEGGTTTAIGLPWIRESTYREVSVADLQFTISNVDPEGRALIMQALAAQGYTAVDVKEL